jgi:CRISPR-associated protein Csm3
MQNVDKNKIIVDVKNILLLLRTIEREGLGGNISRGHGQVSFELNEFFYQKVRESDCSCQFPVITGAITKDLGKVIECVSGNEWTLKGL